MAGSLHMQTQDKVLKELQTDLEKGLSEEVRRTRCDTEGDNLIEAPL